MSGLILTIIIFFIPNIVYAYEKTYDVNEKRTGYHMEISNSWICKHDEKKSSTIECNCSGLNVDDITIDHSIQVQCADGAPDLQITKRWNEVKMDYTGIIGLNPVGHYLEISNIGNGNEANKFGFTASAPWNKEGNEQDVGRWGYAYFGIEFSYCPITKMYYFVGTYHTWYGTLNGTAGTIGHNIYPYSHLVTLYNIVPNTYTIQYNAGQGYGSMQDQTVAYDTELNLEANTFSAPAGKHFTGWKDQNGNTYTDRQSVQNLTDEQNGFVILTAQYTGNIYTIEYNSNGGFGTVDVQTFLYDDSIQQVQILQKNTFTKVKFIPGDWCTTADGTGVSFSSAGKAFTEQLIKEANGTVITLYSKWQPNTYCIRYKYDNSSDGNEVIQSVDRDVRFNLRHIGDLGFAVKKIASDYISDSGFKFLMWNSNHTYSGENYYNMASVKNLAEAGQTFTLYGRWYADVFYNYNFNDAYEHSVYQNVIESESFTTKGASIFTAPPGYTLAAWNTNKEGTGIDFDTDKKYDKSCYTVLGVRNGKANLYAQWNPITYTIQFDSNGGAGRMDDVMLTYDAAATLPACGFKAPAGKQFAGWKSEDGKQYVNQESVINLATIQGTVIKLAAQWQDTSYTIEYNGNGAAGLMDAQIFPCGVSAKLHKNLFKKYYHEFAGWNTKPDGTGTKYGDEVEVRDMVPAGNTMILYAQWNPIVYEKGQFLLIKAVSSMNGKKQYHLISPYLDKLSPDVKLEIRTADERFKRMDFIEYRVSKKEDISTYKKDLKEKGKKYVISHMEDYYRDYDDEVNERGW